MQIWTDKFVEYKVKFGNCTEQTCCVFATCTWVSEFFQSVKIPSASLNRIFNFSPHENVLSYHCTHTRNLQYLHTMVCHSGRGMYVKFDTSTKIF